MAVADCRSPTSTQPRTRTGFPPGRRKKPFVPQPFAHGTDEQVKAYEEAYAEVMAAYDIASKRYRETGKLCPFPAGTFPP